ncbi:MAG: hypothetical protein ACRD3Q_00440, partial [Terriglobales bacterium]
YPNPHKATTVAANTDAIKTKTPYSLRMYMAVTLNVTAAARGRCGCTRRQVLQARATQVRSPPACADGLSLEQLRRRTS